MAILTLTLLPFALVISSSATEAEEVSAEQLRAEQMRRESFMFHYFYNLRENIGSNVVGTCGYVALGMLLTFYDCYWDDGLVSDSYMNSTDLTLNANNSETILTAYENYPSPGSPEAMPAIEQALLQMAHQRATTLEEKIEAWQYYVLGMELLYSDTSLHGKLIVMLDELLAPMISEDECSPKDDGGTNIQDREMLLENYLVWSVGNNYEEDWHIASYPTDTDESTSAAVREEMIEYIVQGIPVLLAVTYQSTNPDTGVTTPCNHAVIAYDYDENEDIIYCHTGWGVIVENQTHCDIEYLGDAYTTQLTNFMALVPLGEHVHSNAYIFDDAPEGICSCELPNHHHEGYVSCSADEHSVVCWCGASPLPHRFQAQGLNRAICIDCGFVKILDLDTPIVRPLDIDLPPVQPDGIVNEEKKA